MGKKKDSKKPKRFSKNDRKKRRHLEDQCMKVFASARALLRNNGVSVRESDKRFEKACNQIYYRASIPKQSRQPIYYLAYSICNHNGRSWDNEAEALEGLGYERSHTNGEPCPIRGIVVVNKHGRSWLHRRKSRSRHHGKPRRRS